MKIEFESGNDFYKYGIKAIETMVCLLISATDRYTQMPDSAIRELWQYPFINGTFGDYMMQHNRVKQIHEKEITQAQNKAYNGAKADGAGSNASNSAETPPAAKETAKTAIMQAYTPKPVGRPKEPFGKAIADKYIKKASIIENFTYLKLTFAKDPQAVIALFVVYFNKGIIKQCPSYWQALRLLDIQAESNQEMEKQCPFGKHQRYNILRNTYFDKESCYSSLNAIGGKEQNEISSFVESAKKQYDQLREQLNPKKQKLKQGA